LGSVISNLIRQRKLKMPSRLLHFDGKTKILEVESSSEVGKAQFEKFKQQIKKGYES
jgi:hypothetical protein